MSNKNLTINLKAKIDKHGKTFYVGKLEAPVMVDCSLGVTFLIFVSDRNQEELQISLMDEKEIDH